MGKRAFWIRDDLASRAAVASNTRRVFDHPELEGWALYVVTRDLTPAQESRIERLEAVQPIRRGGLDREDVRRLLRVRIGPGPSATTIARWLTEDEA